MKAKGLIVGAGLAAAVVMAAPAYAIMPFNVPGSTNILRVAPCDERLIFNTDPE